MKIPIILVALFSLAFFQPVEARCRCFGGSLDLVFVIDRSVSMGEEINEVKTQLQKMVALIKKKTPKLRVGVVTYEATAEMVDLTPDFAKIAKFLQDISVYGGTELVDKALESAIYKMTWKPKAQKVIVLIGDEPPNNYRGAFRKYIRGDLRSYELAGKAKKKGITIHTVSTIQSNINMNNLTAFQKVTWRQLSREWYSLSRLQRTNPRAFLRKRREWYKKFNNFTQAVRKSQNTKGKVAKLPAFEKIARRGGGKSVALSGTKKLITTLLYVSTGLRFDLEKAGKKAVQSLSKVFSLGQIAHSGDWNPPRDFPHLMESASKHLNLSGRSQPFKIDLQSKELFRFPFLYLTGHKSFSFTTSQKKLLQKHLRRGGLLLMDCCCGREPFDRSARFLARQLFPNNPLQKIPSSHSLYHNPFRVEEVKAVKIPMDPGLVAVREYLEGVKYKGRWVIIYSPHCLGCGLEGVGEKNVCGIVDSQAVKIFQNILFYGLTE